MKQDDVKAEDLAIPNAEDRTTSIIEGLTEGLLAPAEIGTVIPAIAEIIKQEEEEDDQMKTTEAVTPAVPTPKIAIVNCKKLNLREKANKAGEVICVLPMDTKLELKATSDNGWARVYTADGFKGYVMRDYITEM